MGNAQSTVPKEGEGHPALYYKGVAAANAGRFTQSELYFSLVLKRHPGAAFWSTMIGAATRKPGSGSDSDGTSPHKAEAVTGGEAVDDVGGPLSSPTDAPTHHGVFEAAGGTPAEAPCDTRDGVSNSKSSRAPTLCAAKAVEVHLPLNGGLHAVMDYVRLLADISLTYMRLLASEMEKEKIMGLAGRYCGFAVSHAQLLLDSLALWKEDRLGDGLGLIDYEKRRSLRFGKRDADDTLNAEADAEPVAGGRAVGQKWRTMDRTASVLLALALLEARMRHLYLSSLLNYSVLLGRVAGGCNEGQKKRQIAMNAFDHLEAAYACVRCLALEYPNEYISKLILAHVPEPAGGARDATSSKGGSSQQSKQLSLSLSKDDHRHLYACGSPWSATQTALVPLAAVRNVRLVVQEDVSRHAQAQLLSPAQRLTYSYTDWATEYEIPVVPGCNLFLLERSLPGFVPGKSTLEHQATLSIRSARQAAAPAAPTGAGGGGEATETAVPVDAGGRGRSASLATAADADRARAEKKKAAELRKYEAELLKKCRTVNSDLHLCDERTCVMLCLEDAAMLALNVVCVQASVLGRCGDFVNSAKVLLCVSLLADGLHGPDSIRRAVMNTVTCGIRKRNEGLRAAQES